MTLIDIFNYINDSGVVNFGTGMPPARDNAVRGASNAYFSSSRHSVASRSVATPPFRPRHPRPGAPHPARPDISLPQDLTPKQLKRLKAQWEGTVDKPNFDVISLEQAQEYAATRPSFYKHPDDWARRRLNAPFKRPDSVANEGNALGSPDATNLESIARVPASPLANNAASSGDERPAAIKGHKRQPAGDWDHLISTPKASPEASGSRVTEAAGKSLGQDLLDAAEILVDTSILT